MLIHNLKTNSKYQLILSLGLKFLGMLLLFAVVQSILSRTSIGVYGQYSQAISLLGFFFSLSMLGLGQSFIKDSACLDYLPKQEFYQQKKSVVRVLSFALSPIIFGIGFFFLNLGFASSLILAFILILFSTLRLRFTFIRTTEKASISELPDIIIKQSTLLLIISLLGKQIMLFQLLLAFLIACFAVYLSQLILDSRLLPIRSSLTHVKSVRSNISRADLLLWIFNCQNTLKDFLELALISTLAGIAQSGQYKILLLFQLAFMSVFNSLNLINSSKYAKVIANGNSYASLNNMIKSESKNGIVLIVIIFCIFFPILYFINPFTYFDLPTNAFPIFCLFLIVPVFNLVLGPVSQLCIHYRLINHLCFSYSIRLALLFSPIVLYWLGVLSKTSFISLIIFIIILELLYLTSLAYLLVLKRSYTPPVLSLFKLN